MKNITDIVLDVINRKNTTYLPSQIGFSSGKSRALVRESLGFSSDEDLDRYLGNHIKFTSTLDDIPAYYCGDIEKEKFAAETGYASIDWAAQRIRDRWGMEFDIYAPDGFFNLRNPLIDLDDTKLASFQTPSLANMDELFSFAESELRKYSDDHLVIVNGYNGVFERSYNLTSFEEFMYLIAAEPKLACSLMDKVIEYKIEIAKQVVQRGFKVGHHGDDLGTQNATLMSKDMFRATILPRLKRLFRVYKDAGVPVMMHSCGNIINFLPDLIDIGLDILEPVQPIMDIQYLKREFGKDLTFFGGVDTQDLLAFQKPATVREVTLRTIDILGHNGGLIISPAQEIMPDVPVENVIAFLDAVVQARGS